MSVRTEMGTFCPPPPTHTHTPLCRKLSKPTCEAEFEAGLVQWIECQPTWSPAFGGSLCLSFILRQILGESWGRDNILCSNTGRGARVIESRIMGGEISNLISSNYTSILASPSDLTNIFLFADFLSLPLLGRINMSYIQFPRGGDRPGGDPSQCGRAG